MRQLLTSFLIALLVLIGGCASFFAPWFAPEQKEAQEGLKSEHTWLGKEQSESAKKDSVKLHTLLAGEYYSRGQYKVAIEEANVALSADSSYAPAYNVLGLVYMKLNEDKLARQNFERALDIGPNDPETLNNFGWFLCQREPEQMDQAMKHFEAALKDPLYSTPEMANTNAGTCELSRGNYRSSEEYFQKALMLKPKYSPALIGLTKMHYSSGNLAAAKLNLARYMHTSTPTAESLWLGVKIERKAGNRQSAASYASQLKKRFPNSKEAIALSKGEF
jgi:type IV pilus assembly protein PilF